MKECDCIHDSEVHDPTTGACLYTNPTFGPCPCAATEKATGEALKAAHRQLKAALAMQASSDLMTTALWSDRFFNSNQIEDNNGLTVFDAAKDFLKKYPECPFDAQWLANNYAGRL